MPQRETQRPDRVTLAGQTPACFEMSCVQGSVETQTQESQLRQLHTAHNDASGQILTDGVQATDPKVWEVGPEASQAVDTQWLQSESILATDSQHHESKPPTREDVPEAEASHEAEEAAHAVGAAECLARRRPTSAISVHPCAGSSGRLGLHPVQFLSERQDLPEGGEPLLCISKVETVELDWRSGAVCAHGALSVGILDERRDAGSWPSQPQPSLSSGPVGKTSELEGGGQMPTVGGSPKAALSPASPAPTLSPAPEHWRRVAAVLGDALGTAERPTLFARESQKTMVNSTIASTCGGVKTIFEAGATQLRSSVPEPPNASASRPQSCWEAKLELLRELRARCPQLYSKHALGVPGLANRSVIELTRLLEGAEAEQHVSSSTPPVNFSEVQRAFGAHIANSTGVTRRDSSHLEALSTFKLKLRRVTGQGVPFAFTDYRSEFMEQETSWEGSRSCLDLQKKKKPIRIIIKMTVSVSTLMPEECFLSAPQLSPNSRQHNTPRTWLPFSAMRVNSCRNKHSHQTQHG